MGHLDIYLLGFWQLDERMKAMPDWLFDAHKMYFAKALFPEINWHA